MVTQPTMVTLQPFGVVGLSTLNNNSHKAAWSYAGSSNFATLPTLGTLAHVGGAWPIVGMKAQ